MTHGVQVPSQVITEGLTVKEPETPTADGWEFDAWYTDKDKTKVYKFDKPVEESFTLYAKWNEKISPEPKPDVPKTGDGNNMIAWVMALMLSLIGFVSTIIYKTKKQK